ncbi:hypothetical protein B0T21DRAFT_409161 [Apiosordaria backusii]|uniref:CST complex subunit Stn1 N-terminal domain-containing protein n=1 Tax=Apiosordaria backusii TaxID=314023 RepID=A0AA40EN21_9PEZI|nr:hypothetical protein B0T21DRAFT_409161 [Apiosordaria backusii]
MTTPGGAPPELEFYPQYCFHLSPTIGRWCHLQATDIAALTFNPGFEGQDVYFYLNHPIKWARIAGVVVAIQEFAHRIIYTIDDSSGATIECVVATPPQFPAVTNYKNTPANANTSADGRPLPKVDGPIDVGHIIDIKGGITVFRDVKQIRAEKVTHLRTTEQEAVFWEKIALLRKEVLCRPWALDPREVRKLRREEEGRVSKQKRTGLERESKRRRLEEDTMEQDESGGRARRANRTGLEKGARIDGVVVADVAKDGRHSHHHRTGLERQATTRTEIQDGEPGSPERRPRKTGLEPRGRSGEEKVDGRPTTRSRQPFERPDLDETLSSSHIQHRTGLERQRSSRSRTRDESVLSSYQPRRTGLEKSSALATANDTTLNTSRLTGLERRSSRKNEYGITTSVILPRKTGLEKPSILEVSDDTTLSTIRLTGLEKRCNRSLEHEPASTLHSRKTGLEKMTSSRRQNATKGATMLFTDGRPHRTGLERATTNRATEAYSRKTDLERQSGRGQEKQASYPSLGPRPTGLEPRQKMSEQNSNPRQPLITGLERQSERRVLMVKNSQSDQQPQEQEKCENKTTTPRSSSIRRPDSQILVRGKGRLTGLEKVTKPITRGPPVTDKYDAAGL